MMEPAELKTTVETLLFITDHPLPLVQLCKIVGEKKTDRVTAVIEELRQEYEARGSGVQVIEIAEGFQMATRRVLAPFVRKLFADKMTMRLSTAALETLSIVAYKQPITRAEIEQIRGVEVIAALETLLERQLVKVVGRKETVGRPLLYGTTADFLRHFGLKNLSEMPPVESFKPADAPQPDLSQAAWTEAGETPAPAQAPAVAAEPQTGASAPQVGAAEPQVGASEPQVGASEGSPVAVAEAAAEEPPAEENEAPGA